MRRILYCFLFIAGGGIIHASAREERVGTEDRIKPDSVLFVDSFDGSSVVPDTAVWKLCTYANNAWSQWFRDVNGYENVKVEDGYLKLRACKDNGTYKNGGVFSKIGFPCGTRLEVKARLTKLVRGGFPAIWQMPIGAPEWPRGGEIDLMEWVQGTPLQIYQTVHTLSLIHI